mgnify:CR=1 FL=1
MGRLISGVLLLLALAPAAADIELFVDCVAGQPDAGCSAQNPCNSVDLAVAKFLAQRQLPTTIWIAAKGVCRTDSSSAIGNAQQLTIAGRGGQAQLQVNGQAPSLFFFTNSAIQLRSLTISNAQIAIRAAESVVVVRDCNFFSNQVAIAAEVLANVGASSLDLADSTFAGNARNAVLVQAVGTDSISMNISISNCIFRDHTIKLRDDLGVVRILSEQTKHSVAVAIRNSRFINNRQLYSAASAPGASLVYISVSKQSPVAITNTVWLNNSAIYAGASSKLSVAGAFLNLQSDLIQLERCDFMANAIVAADASVSYLQGGLVLLNGRTNPFPNISLANSISDVSFVGNSLRVGSSPQIGLRPDTFTLYGGVLRTNLKDLVVRNVTLIGNRLTINCWQLLVLSGGLCEFASLVELDGWAAVGNTIDLRPTYVYTTEITGRIFVL